MELICSLCGSTFSPDGKAWICPCGGLLDARCRMEFDPAQLSGAPFSMWRYNKALPVELHEAVSLGEPVTPLVALDAGEHQLLVKQEQLFPTGSYKDRGAALMISVARRFGIRNVVEDSSGNAACAVAAYCARAGIACTVFVPASASKAKLQQVAAYGATVKAIEGSREDVAAAVIEDAKSVYYASHVYNPWFIEGVKTFAYEIAEQLSWKSPDWLVLPVGNGTLLLGCYIGFTQLLKAGFVDKMPRLVAVQATGCSPLVRKWEGGAGAATSSPHCGTIAEGIAIANPARGPQILQAVRESGGFVTAVDDQEVRRALSEAARGGFYIEPTAAVGLAAARRLLQGGAIGGQIVTAFTGHGLKKG